MSSALPISFPHIRCLTLVLLLSCASTVSAQTLTSHAHPPAGHSLADLLSYAQQHHPQLIALGHEALAAEREAGTADSLPDPQLRIELMDFTNRGAAASSNLLPARVGATKYSLMQALPAWGQRGQQRALAAAIAANARQNQQLLWQNIAADIQNAYHEAQRLQQNRVLTEELIALNRQLESSARERYAQGLVSNQDALRSQMEISQLQAELLRLESDEQRNQTRLNVLLGRPASEASPLLALPTNAEALPEPQDLAQTLIDNPLAANAELASAQTALITAKKARELLRSAGKPAFTVGLAPTQQGSKIREWELMLEFNIPLQQARRRSNEAASEQRIEAARARLQASRQQLLGELATAQATYQGQYRLWQLSRDVLLPQTQLAIDSARASYGAGQLAFTALLDVQRELKRLRLQIINAENAARQQLVIIDRLLGTAGASL